MLELRKINKKFDGNQVIKDISFRFEPGVVYALVGPNGAGKTTLLNIINGFLRPDKGNIFINGENITDEAPFWIAKKGIGRLFQDIRIFRKMNCMENMLVGEHFIKEENPLLSLINFFSNKKKEKLSIQAALKILNNFNLGSKTYIEAEDLSYGEEKLLSLGRLLMAKFDILLLDEPFAGIASQIKEIIFNIILQFVAFKKLIIIVEHELEAIQRVANCVLFMLEGEIIKFGTPEFVLSDKFIISNYMGLHYNNKMQKDIMGNG